MKRLIAILLLVLLCSTLAFAQSASDLTGLGMSAELAELEAGDKMQDAIPAADDTSDLGSSSYEWKDLYVDGTAYIDTLNAGTVVDSYEINVPCYLGAQGATATVGWVVTGTDKGLATLAASATADTLVIPIPGVKIGDTITGFTITGQIESGGNTATVDADLRKLTTAAAGSADASVGAITQISKTADYKIDDAKTGLTEVVASGESFYVLVTATTAASTDIECASIEVAITSGS